MRGIPSNFAIAKLEAEKAELQHDLQLILKALPKITDPQIKMEQENRKTLLAMRIRTIYDNLSSKTIDAQCKSCPNTETIKVLDYDRLFAAQGKDYQCSACWLSEYFAKEQDAEQDCNTTKAD